MAETFRGFQFSTVELQEMTGWPPELVQDWIETVQSIQQYETLTFAGNPENNVVSNFSRLCIDTTGPTLYMNVTVGVDTGWTAV